MRGFVKFTLPKSRFFKGIFMGQAKGRMQDEGAKVAEIIFLVPFHGVDRSACPDARIGDLPSVWRRVPILFGLAGWRSGSQKR